MGMLPSAKIAAPMEEFFALSPGMTPEEEEKT
jgi:hypothetical protein